jgi:hypothetical protein
MSRRRFVQLALYTSASVVLMRPQRLHAAALPGVGVPLPCATDELVPPGLSAVPVEILEYADLQRLNAIHSERTMP